MGTRKISQLETISDANLSGEAILPVVVSDPLIPNRKAKVSQLFRGLSQGTKSEPGLCFDLDRDTGLYQNAYDQIGIGFGDGGFYMSRIPKGTPGQGSSLYITAVDEAENNADLVLSPKGTGEVKVTGNFVISDQTFILEDAQGPRVRFEISNVGTGTNTRILSVPNITANNGTTIVGDDTSQTLTNKTILINDGNLVLFNGTDEAVFELNWSETSNARRSYLLPDAGTVTTNAEPTSTSSTLLDTKAEQIVLNKTFVNLNLSSNADEDTFVAQFNTDALTSDRIITVPDQSITLVGEDSTQLITNKTILGLSIGDTVDSTKKITFDLSNQNTLTNEIVQFPDPNVLNNAGNNNIIVLALASQTLYNKTLSNPRFISPTNASGSIILSTDGITGPRTIKFPDADATLLSTENVTLDDVTFGAGIGANNLTGLTRQQQFFYSGF